MKISAIITAGGSGKRLAGKVKKQFLLLAGKAIIFHTLERFLTKEVISEIIISLPEDEYVEQSKLISASYPESNIKFVKGGKERQDSVYNALKACSKDCDIVFIHDGVRPFFSEELIDKLLQEVKVGRGVIPVSKVKFTIKECENGFVKRTLPRDNLYNVHTPQCFVYQDILTLNNNVLRENLPFTDDASLCEIQGLEIKTVIEKDYNIKITTQDDLLYAEFLLAKLKY